MANCETCGQVLPQSSGPDPMVQVARIEAARDVEVAKISAGITRQELDAEMAALRAELEVRREDPPSQDIDTEIVQVDVEPEPEEPAELPGEAMPEVDEEPPAPPEVEPVHHEEPRSRGWF